jgi:hypothetical protein
MGYIIINSVTFSPPVTTTQYITVRHRLASDPDDLLYYTTDGTGIPVNPDGTLVTPLEIDALLDGETYVVEAYDECGSAVTEVIFITGTTTTTTTSTTTTTTETTSTTTTTTAAPTTTTTSSTTTTTTAIPCIRYTISTLDSMNVEWDDCMTGNHMSATFINGSSVICAITDSVMVISGTGSVTDTGDCTHGGLITTTTTTSTSTTTTTTIAELDHNLEFVFDSAPDLIVQSITVNSAVPSLVSGLDVPFSGITSTFLTEYIGVGKTLNVGITFTVPGQSVTVVDSAGNSYCQNITVSGYYAFPGLIINNTTPVVITGSTSVC